MDKALLWFARIWVTLVIVANLLAVVGLFVGAASFSEWWSRVQKTYSPSNISNVLVANRTFSGSSCLLLA